VGLDTIVPLVLVVVFLLVSGGVKKLREMMEQQGEQQRQRPRADYEASPDEIREFIGRLSAAGMPQEQAAPPVPREGPAGARIAVEATEPEVIPFPSLREPPRPVTGAVPLPALDGPRLRPVPVARPLPAQGAPRPSAARARRPRTQQPRRAAAAGVRPRAPAAEGPKAPAVAPARQSPQRAPAVVPKPSPGLPPLSGSLSLKQAVIWSEILGSPVSLRRSRRGPRGSRP
jgi:hypothetical protein